MRLKKKMRLRISSPRTVLILAFVLLFVGGLINIPALSLSDVSSGALGVQADTDASIHQANQTVIAEGDILGFHYRASIESFNDSGVWSGNDTYEYNDTIDWIWSYEDVLLLYNETDIRNMLYYAYKYEYDESYYLHYAYIDGYGLNQSTGAVPSLTDIDPYASSYALNLTEELANLTALALNNNGTITVDKIWLDWPGTIMTPNGTWLGEDYLFNYEWNITVHVPNYFYDPLTGNYSDLFIEEYWEYYSSIIDPSAVHQARVNVTQVSTGFSYYNGTSIWRNNYNASFEAFAVEIYQPDGNFYITYYAPLYWDYTSIDYYYYEETYEYNYTILTEVYLLEDVLGLGAAGDLISPDLLPSWLTESSSTYSKGHRVSEYNSTGTTTSYTAMQYFGMSLWAVPQPTSPLAMQLASAQRQLTYSYVYWDNFIPAVLYAFRDNNNNGYLDLIVNASSAWFLEPEVDTLEYVAYLESYNSNMTVDGYYFDNSTNIWVDYDGTVYNDSYVYNETYAGEDWSFSYGPAPAATTSVEPSFLTPVFDNVTGTLTFSWGVTYTDFPASFLDWNSWQESNTYLDLEYAYDLRIVLSDTPVVSIAQAANDSTSTNDTMSSNMTTASIYLDTTYYFGEIQNTTLRARMDGLSLANVIDTSFFTESLIEETNATGTMTTGASGMEFVAGGYELGSMDIQGTKASYTLMRPDGNVTRDANAAKIILYREGGSTTFNSTALYNDHVSSDAQGVLTEQTYRYEYQWVQGLFIISYPEWDGYAVVHDPTFSAVSVVSTGGSTDTGDDTTGGDDDTGNTGGEGSDTSTAVPPPEGDVKEAPPPSTPVPGFDILPLLGIGVIMAFLRGYGKRNVRQKK